MTKYFLLYFFLIGCGIEQSCQSVSRRDVSAIGPCYPDQIATRIHPTLQYAIDQFSKDGLRLNTPCFHTATIGFSTTLPKGLSSSTIGWCSPASEVRALRSFWDKASATERLTLLYHELGHCALGLDHKDDAPDIMNSYLLDESIAEKRWDELVTTMFKRAHQ